MDANIIILKDQVWISQILQTPQPIFGTGPVQTWYFHRPINLRKLTEPLSGSLADVEGFESNLGWGNSSQSPSDILLAKPPRPLGACLILRTKLFSINLSYY